MAAEVFLRRSVDLARAALATSKGTRPLSRTDQRLRFLSNLRSNLDRPLVAVSIGPYGGFLADGSEFRGRYGKTQEELMTFHRPNVRVLALAPGVDVVAFETVPEDVRVCRQRVQGPGPFSTFADS